MYCYETESEQQFLDDDQARQIYTAFEIGSQINDPGDLLRHSILKRGGLTPETEAQALNFLIKSKVRQQLSKQGLAFPTRNSFVERIHVEKLSDREWNVWNRSRGTNYLVEDGLQDGLICSCESRTGFCKHRDAVRALLDATQPLNPPRISQPEISEPLEFSDFEDPTINDKDFDPVDDKEDQRAHSRSKLRF